MVFKQNRYHLILIACITLICLSISGNVWASVLTVNSTTDANDGTCNASHCSLREAIIAANLTSGLDTIDFNISGSGVRTIEIMSALPTIASPVVIDATTQPGSAPTMQLVILDGRFAGTQTNGLTITAGDSTIRGLVFNRFGGSAIFLGTNGNNIIEGNFIGTDVFGDAVVFPNNESRGSGTGIEINQSVNNRIGGTTILARNVISGNGNHGIDIFRSQNTLVQGNLIGTDISGTQDRGNFSDGLLINESSNNIIGGTVSSAANVISGNNNRGLLLWNSDGNVIQGNYVGTDATGSMPLGNSTNGITIMVDSDNNIIGGTAVGASNIIAYNGYSGVYVFGGVENLILTNRIFSNIDLEIDVGFTGVLDNDFYDTDDGANQQQNFPWLNSVVLSGGTTNVSGRLNAVPNTTYHIEFYSSNYCNVSGYGEGKTFLNAVNLTTNDEGDVFLSVALPITVLETDFLSATATDPENNTSEFSNCVSVGTVFTPPVGSVVTVNTTADTNDHACTITQCSLREAIEAANYLVGTNTIQFSIPGLPPFSIQPTSPLPTITEPVILDGTSQPSFTDIPIVELDGSVAGSNTDGLRLTGGDSLIQGLVVNRFGNDGIEIISKGSNIIQQNYIGVGITGSSDLGNGNFGIHVNYSPDNIIGGISPALRNVISGNTASGIYIEQVLSSGNIIQGNYIGTDAAGTSDIGNSDNGVWIETAPDNRIGGSLAAERNVISGNSDNGVSIGGGNANDSSGNLIAGNYIGTDMTGTSVIPNDLYGVRLQSGDNNTIGGATGTIPGGACTGECNLISGNGSGIIVISGTNLIQGNYIGTDPNGTVAVGNHASGVVLNGHDNLLGGLTPQVRNIIAGYLSDGVILGGTRNQVQGNYIGSDVSGMVSMLSAPAIGIYIGGTENLLGGTSGVSLGGSCSGACNLIVGNAIGVRLYDGANANLIAGNFIGANVSGTSALGNTIGIRIESSAENLIGGDVPEARNLISGNLVFGIEIGESSRDNSIQGNYIGVDTMGQLPLANLNTGVQISGGIETSILSNVIASNGNLGINLGTTGVTFNDPGDADTGPNNLQNFPVLISADPTTTGVTIMGDLNSQPNQTYRLEFFLNPSCDPSGNGEGQTYMGFRNITTGGGGNVAFIANFSVTVANGQFITATATDPNNNTSEFSACVPVIIIPPPSAPVAAPERNYSTTSSVSLSWKGLSWATGYEIEVDTDDDFVAPYEYANRSLAASTQSDTPPLLGDGVYYWRVGTKKAGGGIVWSAVQSFTVDVP